MLFDSVPPEVKKYLFWFYIKAIFAINFLLSSIMVFESLPKECVDDGLPYELTRTEVISSTTF